VTPKVLIPEEKIRQRVQELADEISEAFQNTPVTIISVLKGALVFTADLIRLMKVVVEVDFIRVKSYCGEKKSKLEATYKPELSLKGKNVLIVDDIFDTGESLQFVYKEILNHSPANIKTCVLLEKETEKKVDIRPDFVGFTIPNRFVVGYGLDLNDMYRSLPYIGYFERKNYEEKKGWEK
jgi:hypoxanthine phosphoribosyltransferase